MEEIGDGMAAVEAEARVLQGIVTMGSIYILVVVLVEEILTGPMATMVGGLEAVVLDIEGNEVEVLWVGIGVLRSEKIVQKGELKLSNGTGRRNKGKLVTRTIQKAMMIIKNRVLHKMAVNLVIIRYSNNNVEVWPKICYQEWQVIWFVTLSFALS